MGITFTDLHLHTEYSLKDGMIRVVDYDDPKHHKMDIVLNAERRGTGVLTATDHGNMYAHGWLAILAKTFDLKHIPASEFYIAPGSRHEKATPKGETVYRHLCAWAKNRIGYQNLCNLTYYASAEGFYYQPRIDKELLERFGEGIMVSDACVGGTISGLINEGKVDEAYSDLLWYLDRFGDDFYIEYQNHGIAEEDAANAIKLEWAKQHGIAVIATTDAHFHRADDFDAHKTLLAIQYSKLVDDPTFTGFPGTGYHLMDETELLQRYPVEFLNNTQLLVDKVESGIIQLGKVTPPKFKVPDWFVREVEGSETRPD